MTRPEITYYTGLIQGSDEWHAARCGLLTASEMRLVLTPTLKIASNDKSRAHMWELLAQRLTGYVEPHYISDAMLRGHEDEILARHEYGRAYAPVAECGFVTNERYGFTLGCSPDGLVGEDGMIEVKSRSQKYQVQTLCEWTTTGSIPPDYVMQVQTALLVTERKWCDLISYSGGLPMVTMRVEPDERIQSAIIEAAAAFEASIAERLLDYTQALRSEPRLIPTKRRVELDIIA